MVLAYKSLPSIADLVEKEWGEEKGEGERSSSHVAANEGGINNICAAGKLPVSPFTGRRLRGKGESRHCDSGTKYATEGQVIKGAGQ